MSIAGKRLRELLQGNSPGFLLLCMVLSVWFFQTCTPESEDPEVAMGYEWFPLAVGNSRMYAIDSVTFRYDGSRLFRDSVSLQARELIAEVAVGENGDSTFVVERYERRDAAEPWRIRKVFSMNRQERQAFRTEDNLRLIKLVFPFRRGTTWQSTLFIDPTRRITVNGENIEMFKGWQSEIRTIDTSYLHGQIALDGAILVSHADLENLIERRWIQEMYAPHIGLIFQQQYILDTQCRSCCNGDFALCGNYSWLQKAEKGFVVTQRLLEWE